MAFYKLISDGVALDAVSDETAQWVVENRNNYSTFIGNKEEAIGILASDGSVVFHVDGKEKFHDYPDYVTVKMEEIGEGEYRAILEDIEAGKVVEIEQETGQEQKEEPEPMTLLRSMAKKLEELTAEPEVVVDTSLDGVRKAKIEEMSRACNAAIVSGVDVLLSDGEMHHFSLSIEDQINLASLQTLLAAGQEAVPYHADGEPCRFFGLEEFEAVVTSATQWKLYHESYFNNMKVYINRLEDLAEVNSIVYGNPIPEEYMTDVLKGILGL